MTWAIFAVGWINVGDFDRSAPHFQRGYANVHKPFNVWTESPTGGTINFITGAGGFLQSAIFGTSGMRLVTDGLTFLPPPPTATGSAATRLGVRSFHFRGNRLAQSVTADKATYELLSAKDGAPALALETDSDGGAGAGGGGGSATALQVGKPVTVNRAYAKIVLK